MTDSVEWDLTIIGALLCLVYSWFIAAVGRSQGIRFGKIGPAVGISGALILAGMAVVGPPHVSKFERVIPMNDHTIEIDPHINEANLINLKRRSLAIRTTREAGPKPSKDHTAWEYPNGRLAWVTKLEYQKLKKGK